MAIGLDAAGTLLSTTTAGTSISYTGLTVGSGANRGLVLAIGFDSSSVSAPTATWDSGGTNQTMTRLNFQTATPLGYSFGAVALFGLVNPTSGAKTLACSWTGSSASSACAVSFLGVNQNGGSITFPNQVTATATSATASVTVPTQSGNACVICCTTFDVQAFNSGSANILFIDSAPPHTSNASEWVGSASSSVTQTFALSGSDIWLGIGTDILAASNNPAMRGPRLKQHLRR